jgi:hypothetical protein
MAYTTALRLLELGAEGVIPLGSVDPSGPTWTSARCPPGRQRPHLPGPRARLRRVPDAELRLPQAAGRLTQGLRFGPLLRCRGSSGPGTVRRERPVEARRRPRGRPGAAERGQGGPSGYGAVLEGPAARRAALRRPAAEPLRPARRRRRARRPIYVSLRFSRAARFDWAHWSYSSLGTDAWTLLGHHGRRRPSLPAARGRRRRRRRRRRACGRDLPDADVSTRPPRRRRSRHGLSLTMRTLVLHIARSPPPPRCSLPAPATGSW